jgi:hypothetical protein
MSILDTDKTLPANKLIFEIRRDAKKRERFRTDLEGLMRDYGLSEEEKAAFRQNDSDAAQLYAEKMLKGNHG